MKHCYSLTFLGPNANGGNDFRINSTIYISCNDGSLIIEELMGFANYIQQEIRTVWSTATNPGLSAGNGAFRYNRTLDTFRCTSPTDDGIPATHDRDTGVIVTTNPLPPRPFPIRLKQNEIVFNVVQQQPPNERPYLNPKSQRGQLYYLVPNVPRILPFLGAGIPILYNPNTDPLIGNNIYQSMHNTAAHEFGHALGLMDRYHYLAQGHYTSQGNTPANNNGQKSNAWISRCGGGDVPMYLQGFFDSRRSGYITNNQTGFIEGAPPYSSPVYRNNLNQPIIPTPVNSTPQPDYNPELTLPGVIAQLYSNTPENHRGVYDVEYSTLYGWELNIMSKRMGYNDPRGLYSNKHLGQYVGVGLTNPITPPDPLFLTIYQPELILGGPEIVGITKTQTDVITDTGGNFTILPSIGLEIISHRYENERAADHGFPKGMFDQYVFILSKSDEQNLYVPIPSSALNSNNLISRGIPPAQLGLPDLPNSPRREFFNTHSGGTFLGIHYSGELNKDGIDKGNGQGGNNFQARIMCDWKYNSIIQGVEFNNTIGISDCMDYRMSNVVSTSPSDYNYLRWEPNQWDYPVVSSPNPDGDGFLGFINPNIPSNVQTRSNSRRYESMKLNLLNRVGNFEIGWLTESSLNGFSNTLVTAYGNARINSLVLEFGSLDPLRYLERVLQQAIWPNKPFIFDGKYKQPSSQFTGAVFNANPDDAFANVGIASLKARQIWNAKRNDFGPVLRVPINTGGGGIPIVGGSSPSIDPTIPYALTLWVNGAPDIFVNVTGWTDSDVSGDAIRYKIKFDQIPPGPFPNNYRLKEEYEMKVRYFSNRSIIELITLPS